MTEAGSTKKCKSVIKYIILFDIMLDSIPALLKFVMFWPFHFVKIKKIYYY